ncbi:hypothetical protein MMC25_007229 [Agyrium rufum]|nr:hypothetical protein [Agyrium rufum]
MYSSFHNSVYMPKSRQTFKSSMELQITPFDVIDATLATQDEDADFWWRTTGYSLAVLLQKAGYGMNVQYTNLIFYFNYVATSMGRRPDYKGRTASWKSFMTDDATPIELSWSWGHKNADPVVRYSIEPISYFAGAASDPFNQHATMNLIDRMRHLLPDIDLAWYNHFSSSLLEFDHSSTKNSGQSVSKDHASHTFVAFDLEDNAVRFKAYFLPTPTARGSTKTNFALITEAIRKLPTYTFPSYDLLLSYMASSSQTFGAEILGLDCIAPQKSRLKLYLRSRSTSFASVRDTMTLGGRCDTDSIRQGLVELKKLWRLVLDLDEDFSEEEELSHSRTNHRTGGILYYAEMKPGQAIPTIKVYIPVRHYSTDDACIANGVTTYLRSRDSSASQYNRTNDFLSALSSICPARLSDNIGAQTYVSCVIKDGALGIISYISPEIYKHAANTTVEVQRPVTSTSTTMQYAYYPQDAQDDDAVVSDASTPTEDAFDIHFPPRHSLTGVMAS